MARRSLWLLLFLGLLSGPFAAVKPASATTSYTALYSFGDSLSDVGNAFAATGGALPVPPYSNGRFSNGPIWLERLAAGLNLPAPQPALLGGTNFATGGATIAPDPILHNDIGTQVSSYLFEANILGAPAPPGALFTVWAGSNDLLDGLTQVLTTATSLSDLLAKFGAFQLGLPALAQSLADRISDLVLFGGARDLLAVTVPDLGKSPRAQAGQAYFDAVFGNIYGPVVTNAASFAAATFNQALLTDLAQDSALALARLHILDAFGLIDTVTANPGAYGFTNATNSCLAPPTSYTSPGTPCATPNGYVFWDDIHPTTRAHAIIGSTALGLVVPEPASMALLLAGLGGMIALRQRRRGHGCWPAASRRGTALRSLR